MKGEELLQVGQAVIVFPFLLSLLLTPVQQLLQVLHTAGNPSLSREQPVQGSDS